MNTNTSSLKMLIRAACLMLMMLVYSSCNGSKQFVYEGPTPIKTYAFDFVKSDNLKSVLKQAEKENKLVFVDVYTTWCLPCKMMDQNVFSHQETADIINKNFISYKVDAEKSNGPIVSFNYDVIEYPTLLFLDSNGKILERKDGAVYNAELLKMAQSALDQVVLGG